VSSFGVSGTNAHVVLAESPALDAASMETPVRAAELVVLSGKTRGAVEQGAARLLAHLEAHPEQGLGDVAYGLATSRTHHGHRLSLSVGSREALVRALDVVRAGQLPAGSARGEGSRRAGKLAWLFTGQGAQTLGMGRELYEAWPVFRDALEQAWAALDPQLDEPLRSVMWAEIGSEQASKLDETAYTQPALFALEVALAALWRSWGVEPDLVAGHSIGELVAAHVAGVLSLGDTARLVVARGRLMQELRVRGAMVSISATEAVVGAALAGAADSVAIAAINDPESVVISGAEDVVLSIAEGFARRGVRTKRLVVSHAFHSPLMDPMLSEFRQVAESVTYLEARLPLVSNVTGAVAGPEIRTSTYWVRHVREAVRFGDGVGALQKEGVGRFLEVGPKATLLGLVPASMTEAQREEALMWPSLRANRGESEAMLEALGGY
jgi:acyl transferase domain-containing protein